MQISLNLGGASRSGGGVCKRDISLLHLSIIDEALRTPLSLSLPSHSLSLSLAVFHFVFIMSNCENIQISIFASLHNSNFKFLVDFWDFSSVILFAYLKFSLGFSFICNNPEVFQTVYGCSCCCSCCILFNLLATKRSLPNSFDKGEFSFVCTDRAQQEKGEGCSLRLSASLAKKD